MKNKHAQEMAKLRSKSLTKARRKEIGKNAIKARWDKAKLDKKDINTDNKNILA